MPGKGFALTARDRRILLEVGRFGLITKNQLIRLGVFRSNTRAKERLKALVDEKYLTARPQPIAPGGPRFVYLLGPGVADTQMGRRRLAEVSDLFLSHELGLVDIRIAIEQRIACKHWSAAKDLSSSSLGVVPDAYCEYDLNGLTFCVFVEYDRGTETLARFERKARAYADLAFSGRFEKTFHRKFFRVFVIAESEQRLVNLSSAVARATNRIFWLTTLSELSQHGPLASIWRRPGTDRSEPLTVA